MKIPYESPQAEIIRLSSKDIVTTSPNSGEIDWSDENTQEGGWICY